MRLFILTLLLATVALVAGCNTSPVIKLYEGPKRAADNLTVVRVPMELEVLTVNGQRIKNINTVFSVGYKDLHLEPGRYELLAYYKDLFDLNADDHDVITSDPALFIVEGKAGEIYRLGFDEPADVHQARKLADNFSGWTEHTDSGKKVPTRESGLVLENSLTSMISDMTDSTPVIEDDTPEGTRKAASQVVAPKTEPAPQNSDSNSTDQGYLDLLKVYWSQATDAERRQFLQWIAR